MTRSEKEKLRELRNLMEGARGSSDVTTRAIVMLIEKWMDERGFTMPPWEDIAP